MDHSASRRTPYEHPDPLHASYNCSHCEKQYSAWQYLRTHERSGCPLSRQNLVDLLQQTKTLWENRKRRRGELSENHVPTRQTELEPGREQLSYERPGSSSAGESHRGEDLSSPHTLTPAAFTKRDLRAPVAVRKAKRESRLPARFVHDTIPAPPPPLFPSIPMAAEPLIDFAALEAKIMRVPSPTSMLLNGPALVVRESERSQFGVMRKYLLPSTILLIHDPDQLATLQNKVEPAKRLTSYGPFKTRTAFLLAEWYWTSTRKSFDDFQKLLSVFKGPDFSLHDAINVNWQAAFSTLGANKSDLAEEQSSWISDEGWLSTTISIDIPFHKQTKEPGTHSFTVGQFRHRSIVSVIKEKVSSRTDTSQFHYYPYEATWNRTQNSESLRLYGEMYTSCAFNEEHERVQRQRPTQLNDGLERVVVALMLWSDSTQLTSFGGASLWPCYLFFGNESKYRRGKPSEKLGHQIAYFMKLPDKLNDYLKAKNGGRLPTEALFAYCTRELFHQQWSVLLSPELVDAMRYGIVLRCPDGKERCFFPRIFSYSADYPEKTLICGIRNNGSRPCHRCLIGKDEIFKLGAPTDSERVNDERCPGDQLDKVSAAQAVIQRGYATAFARNLPELNVGALLVVDILHEFEIGVWKRLYIHLIRMLHAFTGTAGVTLTAELDARYREIPAFGRDTIRKFPLNASQLRRKAARDYEDLLQAGCFRASLWHALAKLRLHHDFTLALLDYTTTHLGAQMRLFYRDTCLNVPTKELVKEAEARARKAIKDGKGAASASQRATTLNVFTIKFHFLGDYSSTIRRLGTTDSYSTQTGELYHRVPKSWYPRTDKRDYAAQLSRIERRQSRLRRIRAEMEIETATGSLPSTSGEPSTRGRTRIGAIDLSSLAGDMNDAYLVGFVRRLKKHLLSRLLDLLKLQLNSVSGDQWPNIILRQNRIYSHKLLRINYTTYDIRRDQDVLHIDTPQCNVMLLNNRYTAETRHLEHPYIYGKLLGVFHANVSFLGLLPDGVQWPPYRRIDFVWVHWYRFIGGNDKFSLDRVSPVPLDSNLALDFIDPADIIRAVHLIPQFSSKKVEEPDTASLLVSNEHRWGTYFVNRFVDRDTFMRYQLGMSVGHTYMHTMPAFPPPHIPSIPADFDHCLDIAPSATVPTPTQREEASLHQEQPDSTRHEQQEEVDYGEQNTNPCDQDERLGEANDSDLSETSDVDEDRLDHLDDTELVAYDDMYGEDGGLS
ncbi:hypothetical protein NMY22_g1843 [Coprinellus aureogranulatus]|nr:hypothetical protein NMY22_g1843 [Coprinellus aureogranulatus]